MVQGQVDVGNGAARGGGEVPYRLHFGVRLMDFLEGGRPGPKAQV